MPRKHRTDKIEHYPPSLVKILCVSKSAFKRLKVLVGVRRKRRSRGLAPWLKNKKHTRVRVLERNKNAGYEPTEIAHAYDSQRWQWIRVKQWFNDHKEEYTLTD